MSDADVRVVVLTGEEEAHRFVANAIAARVDVAAVVIPETSHRNPVQQIRRSVSRHGPAHAIDRLALQAVARALRHENKRRAALNSVLGPSAASFRSPGRLVRVGPLRASATAERIAALEPDILAIYGTQIVPPAILELPRLRALNLHTGLSPYYRGADCDFWPLFNKELDLIGVTVHVCTPEVDAGPILATSRVDLQRDDDRFTVFPRQVAAGGPLYAEVVAAFSGGHPPGEPQDLALGREYRIAMKGVREELRVRRLV